MKKQLHGVLSNFYDYCDICGKEIESTSWRDDARKCELCNKEICGEHRIFFVYNLDSEYPDTASFCTNCLSQNKNLQRMKETYDKMEKYKIMFDDILSDLDDQFHHFRNNIKNNTVDAQIEFEDNPNPDLSEFEEE